MPHAVTPLCRPRWWRAVVVGVLAAGAGAVGPLSVASAAVVVPAVTAPAAAASSGAGTANGHYLVRRGDTLGALAPRFGTTVAALAAACSCAAGASPSWRASSR